MWIFSSTIFDEEELNIDASSQCKHTKGVELQTLGTWDQKYCRSWRWFDFASVRSNCDMLVSIPEIADWDCAAALDTQRAPLQDVTKTPVQDIRSREKSHIPKRFQWGRGMTSKRLTKCGHSLQKRSKSHARHHSRAPTSPARTHKFPKIVPSVYGCLFSSYRCLFYCKNRHNVSTTSLQE